MFTPEIFLNSSLEGKLDTSLEPVPEGEYLAQSSDVTAESFRDFDIKKGPNAGKKGYGFDLDFLVMDDDVTKALGRQGKVRWGTMLDVTEQGGIDMGKGKNVKLGQLREALGQNDGSPWSFTKLANQIVKVKVKHRVDERDSTRVYAEVVAVTKA